LIIKSLFLVSSSNFFFLNNLFLVEKELRKVFFSNFLNYENRKREEREREKEKKKRNEVFF
jgi:hypothetical protein